MADAVQQLFTPNSGQMAEHVEHLFGGFLGGFHDGLVELAWTDPAPPHALRHAELYGTDRLEELVARAAKLNATPFCNVYIGAALRKPETAPFARTEDSDFLALTCGYVDLDEPGSATAAKDKYGTNKPTRVVVTGNVPHPRAQMWWRLDEPITDPQLSRALLTGMAAGLAGDPTVVNPARVMRLAGSVAWPIKPSRVTEITSLMIPAKPTQVTYPWEQLARLFPPPQPTIDTGGIHIPGDGSVVRATTVLGFDGPVVDGRETYMLRTLTACLVQLLAETGAPPSPQALFDLAWGQFSNPALNDINRPRANGQPWTPEAFADRVNYTLKRFAEGKIRGARTPAEAVARHAEMQARSGQKAAPVFQAAAQRPASGAIFEYLNVEQILALPDPKWLIDRLMIENSLGIIYGPPGSLKSFISLDVALSLATRQKQWWGYDIGHTGTVVYISSEGIGNYKFRLRAWAAHRGVDIAGAPFRLIKQPMNFMEPGDIGKLVGTVQAIVDETGPVVAVFVDTVSRVLPGAKENQQEDMSIFVGACDAVRNRFATTVIGIHHANYAGGIRGSTVIPAAGDFVLETRREPGAMIGSIFVKKVKDGEDGWERHFEVKKVPVGDLGGTTSLVVDGVADEAYRPQTDGLPHKDICRQILTAIDEQWQQGKPWRHSKNSPLCAEVNISRRWRLERKTIARLLEEWNANGIISEEMLDSKRRIKGYRKMIDI